MKRALKTFALACLLPPLLAPAQESIVDTVHNLSSSGPGQYKSDTIDQICAFCHTPHTAAPGPGLWNRSAPKAPEEMYSSSTSVVEDAELSGSSLWCQSCHDGTIALGQMRHPPRRGGAGEKALRRELLEGRSRIGTNLANHHPIGFDYQNAFTAGKSRLKQHDALDLPLEQGKVQCTSCHDAHSSVNQPFLHKPSNRGELCLSCHELSGKEWTWTESSHAISKKAPRAGNPWPERKPEWAGRNVEENSCQNCHASHHANPAERLMVAKEESLCMRCHNGSTTDANLIMEFHKYSRHPIDADNSDSHNAVRKELRLGMQLHSECEDCHNPHASKPSSPMVSIASNEFEIIATTRAPYANGVIAGVPGIDIGGEFKEEIDYQYELCFRCHGERGRSACGNRRCSTADNLQLIRQDDLYNLREKVDPANPQLVSWHPIAENNQQNNDEVPSLFSNLALNATDSLIYCTDCHNNDSAAALGGDGPNGPHGSRHAGLLAFGYELNPSARFNVSSDRLCFTCHDSDSLFSDVSFLHRKHVLEEGNICASCHDPHGSAVYRHLLNFLVSANVGQNLTITGASGYSEPTWLGTGRYAGTCYLSCHGVLHDGAVYGQVAQPPPTGK